MYRDLFQISNEYLVITDLDGRFQKINPAFRGVMGWDLESLDSETLFSLVHADDTEEVMRAMTKMSTGALVYQFTCRMRQRSGRFVSVAWDIAPMPHKGQLYLFAAGRDVTEELETLRELQRANRDLNDFASVASHELRSPLRRIVGLCEIMREDYMHALDGDAQEILSGIVQETYAMEDVVTSLLQYTRVKSSEMALKPVNMIDVVRAARGRALSHYEGQGSPEVEIVHPLPTVDGDQRQLELLFENLFSNGLKFNRHETPKVRVSYDAATSRFLVEDNGVGIPITHTERVFEMFERASAEFPGHGVGLALCRRIAERHKGHLWVADTSDQGTRFALTLWPDFPDA